MKRKSTGVKNTLSKPNKLPNYLTKEVISEILDNARKTKYRDYIMLLVLWNTGVRVSELINIKKKDIIESTIIVRQGKGKKDRTIPINSHLTDILCLYTDNIHTKSKLFNIKTRQVRNIVNKYTPKGINAYPHMFRHSFAVHCLKNGMNLRNLQKLLGHRSLSTTEIYLDVTAIDTKNDYFKVWGE